MARPPFKFFGKIALFVLVFGTLAVFATQSLWNWLAVPLFGLPLISFFQAFGLMVLGRLLTGSFGRRGGGGCHRGGHRGGHFWANEMREKWQNMTPEQRREMKANWREKGWRGWQQSPANDPESPETV